jgi:hypothetical protein
MTKLQTRPATSSKGPKAAQAAGVTQARLDPAHGNGHSEQ